MEAMLLLCVSLVQGAVFTLRMIFNRKARDWHTVGARDDLPQAKSSIHSGNDPLFVFPAKAGILLPYEVRIRNRSHHKRANARCPVPAFAGKTG